MRLVAELQNSGDWDVKYSYLAGSGSAWSAPQYLAGSTAADEGFPDLRNYTSQGNPYVNASYISDDDVYRSVYRRYANAGVDAMVDTLRINQAARTGTESGNLLHPAAFSGAAAFCRSGLTTAVERPPAGAADHRTHKPLQDCSQPNIARPFRFTPSGSDIHDRRPQIRSCARNAASQLDGRTQAV